MKKIYRKIDTFFFMKGFAAKPIRQLLIAQCLLSVIFLTLGAALAVFSLWPLAFGLGSMIAGFHFWQIARCAQRRIEQNYSTSGGIIFFLAFTFRFMATGLLLGILIIGLRMPVIPLLAGLSSSIICIFIWGIAHVPHKLSRRPDTCP